MSHGVTDGSRPREMLDVQAQRIARVEKRFNDLIGAVIPIGIALLEERNFNRLLETILVESKRLCQADGGTLYLRSDDDQLHYAIVRNDTLGISMGGTAGGTIPFAPLPLYRSDGEPNHGNVATHAALTGGCVDIADAYAAAGFDFSGTRSFDSRHGYRSTSFLTAPLKDNQSRVIGVLQLLNARDPATGAVVSFEPGLIPVVESLSQLAAAALQAYIREESLRAEIAELRIRIDEGKKTRQVAEIAETDYFRDLQRKARELRSR